MKIEKRHAEVILQYLAIAYNEGQGPQDTQAEDEILTYIEKTFPDLVKNYSWLPLPSKGRK